MKKFSELSKKEWIEGIAALIFCALFLLGFRNCIHVTPEEKAEMAHNNCESTGLAFVMSQDFIKQKLKAPSSAKFPSKNDAGVSINYLGDCRHTVVAWVDAQNAFGAALRRPYVAVVQYHPKQNEWSAEIVVIE